MRPCGLLVARGDDGRQNLWVYLHLIVSWRGVLQPDTDALVGMAAIDGMPRLLFVEHAGHIFGAYCMATLHAETASDCKLAKLTKVLYGAHIEEESQSTSVVHHLQIPASELQREHHGGMSRCVQDLPDCTLRSAARAQPQSDASTGPFTPITLHITSQDTVGKPIECKAAMAWEAKKPLEVTNVIVNPPGPGEVCMQ